jgi:hypothetical protein
VSFIPEQGAHAGPSREELHTFIIHPDRVRLPAPIVHPVQLYPGVRHVSGASTPLTLVASRGRALTVVARTSPLCIFYNRQQ